MQCRTKRRNKPAYGRGCKREIPCRALHLPDPSARVGSLVVSHHDGSTQLVERTYTLPPDLLRKFERLRIPVMSITRSDAMSITGGA
jgi:hypothetical protein